MPYLLCPTYCAQPLPQDDVQAIATIATLQSLTLAGEVAFCMRTLDLSWLGALHHLRKLDLRGLHGDLAYFNGLHLGGGGGGGCTGGGSTSGGGGVDSGCRGRSLPPCLEELLLPRAIQVDDRSVRALAGLRHLTRLSATLSDSVCSDVGGRPLAPLTATLQHVELWVVSLPWHVETPICALPVVAGLLAAKPPAALRLALSFSKGDRVAAPELLRLLGIAESVRSLELLSISNYGWEVGQVSCWLGLGRAGPMGHVWWWPSCRLAFRMRACCKSLGYLPMCAEGLAPTASMSTRAV